MTHHFLARFLPGFADRSNDAPSLAGRPGDPAVARPSVAGDAGSQADRIERARTFLRRHWTPEDDRYDLEQLLIVAFDLDGREAALLLAERTARHRVEGAGLGAGDGVTSLVDDYIVGDGAR